MPAHPAPARSQVAVAETESVFDLLHDAPLLPGESQADLAALQMAVLKELNPAGLIEQIGARELLSVVWEERRLRRLRDAFINANLEQVLKSKLDKLVDYDDASLQEMERLDLSSYEYAQVLAHHYVTKNPEIILEVTRLFEVFQISMDEIVSQVFVREMEAMQDFDRLISNSVQHRNRLIADFERRKEVQQRLTDKMDALLVNG